MASPKKLTKPEASQKRVRISQEDVPAFSLTETLRVATALHDNFGKDPAPPIRLAAAMGLTPGSSQFKMLTGASIAYGLTSGGYNAAAITLQPLGGRILKPLEDGADLSAKREAFLKPRVIGEFLRKYDGSPVPKTEIGCNVLEDMGVPTARANAILEIITSGARELGLLHEIKGKFYVDLSGTRRHRPKSMTIYPMIWISLMRVLLSPAYQNLTQIHQPTRNPSQQTERSS